MADILAVELKAYTDNLDALLGANEGKFVLIHGDEVLGVFDSNMDAITRGYRELGNVPFLVKHIVKVEAPLNFVSNLLGV
jgi:hypothetical protein